MSYYGFVAEFQELQLRETRKSFAVEKSRLEFVLGVSPEVASDLWRQGEIIPPDHQFSQLLFSIGKKIGIPADYSIIGLDSDNASAFCLPKEKVIVVSRGLTRQALKKSFDLKEDHLAAVLCHEFTHRDSPGRAPNQTKSQSEELRADAEGMERLALSGYNPKAMIDFFETIGLTSGRLSQSHPETIDRIRHLELRLTDDIHPIPNVGNKMTALDEQVVNYLQQESNVYQETEALLSLNADQLQERLLNTKEPDEFWMLYNLERHARRIEQGKVLAEDPALQRIVRKSILLRTISGDQHYFLGNKLQNEMDNDHRWELRQEIIGNQQGIKIDNWRYTQAFGIETKSPAFWESMPYRLGLSKSKVDPAANEEFQQRKVLLEVALDKEISEQLTFLDSIDQKLPSSYRAYFQEVKRLCTNQSMPITSDVFSSAFDFLTPQVAEQSKNKKDSWLDEHGIRRSGEAKTVVCDFTDPKMQEEIFEAACLSTAVQLLEEIPKNQEAINHWTRLLGTRYGLNPEQAGLFSSYMFNERQSDWFNYLASYPREELPTLHDILIKIDDREKLLRKSAREKGKSFEASTEHRAPHELNHSIIERNHRLHQVHPFWGGGFGSTEEVLQTMCPLEIFKRANPPEHRDRFDRWYNGLGIRLTTEEYRFIKENIYKAYRYGDSIDRSGEIERQLRAGAISRALEAWKKGEKPAEADILAIKEMKSFGYVYHQDFWADIAPTIDLEPGEILLLYENIPWSKSERAERLSTWLAGEKLPDLTSKLNKVQREKFIEMLKDLYFSFPAGAKTEYIIDGHNFYQERKQEIIAKFLVKLTLSELPVPQLYVEDPLAEEKKQKIIQALINLKDQGFHINMKVVYDITIDNSFSDIDPNTPTKWLLQIGTAQDLEKLASVFDNQPLFYSEKFLSFSEQLRLLPVFFPQAEKSWRLNEFLKGVTPPIGREVISDLLSLVKFPTDQGEEKRESYGEYDFNMAYCWIMSHFRQGIVRDHLLAGLAETVKPGQEKPLGSLVNSDFSEIDVNDEQTKRNTFSYENYFIIKRDGALYKPIQKELLEGLKGEGRLRREFPDILSRRFAFTAAPIPGLLHTATERLRYYGSPSQRFFAKELLAVEDRLLNGDLPLGQRIRLLSEIAPHQSPVRDTYVEWMLKDGLQVARTAQERYELSEQLLSLFSKDCPLKQPLFLQRLRDEIEITENFWVASSYALETVVKYLPTASLARNYFLDLIEEKCTLTPDEIEKINGLRVSEEGQRVKEDSGKVEAGSEVMILNALSEQNREEKCKTVLWVLGASEIKPLAIVKTEEDQDGSLDSFRRNFAGLTPPERDVLLSRMLLGAEGVLDLEAVPVDQQAEALKQRDQLLITLAQYFIPKDSPSSEIFQKIFVTIFQNAQPAKGAQMLEKLINLSIDRTAKNGRFTTEELVVSSLNQLGVVGKKVSQSLSEMDWVPASYKRELIKTQEGAETLPKRSLLVFAKAAGIIEDGGPIKITSFDKLLGAASNKQACLLTVEVNDEVVAEQLGINPGETTQVVGKFKRPSAQKEENIDQDLTLLTKVIQSLREFGTEVSLPPGFSDQIGMAVRQELDFEREKGFAEKIRADILRRGNYRGYTVGIPEIIYSGPDLVLETLAPGNSLRGVIDQQRANNLSESDINTSLASVRSVVLREALYEILYSGNIHADLHPGNVFVDEVGKRLTLIDLGMHTEINSRSVLAAREILIGLALGRKGIVLRALNSLGWQLGEKSLKLKIGDFNANAKEFLSASKSAEKTPPQEAGMIILSVSKLEPYLKGLKLKEATEILREIIPPSQWKLHLEALAIEEGMATAEKLVGKREK